MLRDAVMRLLSMRLWVGHLMRGRLPEYSTAAPAGHGQGDPLFLTQVLVRVFMPVLMRLGWDPRERRRNRLVVRQALGSHLGTAFLTSCRIDAERARLEHRAVVLFRRLFGHVAATHIALQRGE